MRMAVHAVPMTVRNWACHQMDGSAAAAASSPTVKERAIDLQQVPAMLAATYDKEEM